MDEQGWIINGGNSPILYHMAEACAMSIKQNSDRPVCIAVDKQDKWPKEYDSADYIVEYPFGDTATGTTLPQLNQSQLYHCTPFEHSIIVEADGLLTSNIDSVWRATAQQNIALGRSVVNFRGNNPTIKQRQHWSKADLPNVFAGMWSIKQSDEGLAYAKMLDIVCQHWREVAKLQLPPEHIPDSPNADLLHSITCKLMDDDHTLLNDALEYTFIPDEDDKKWNFYLNFWYYNGVVKVDNFRQHGFFKYVETDVITNEIFDGIRSNTRSRSHNSAT